MNEFGEAEIVRRRRRRRGPARSSTTSTGPTRRSRSRCRASPTSPTTPTPVGVFRAVDRPTYEDEMQRQLVDASAERAARPTSTRCCARRRPGPSAEPSRPTSVERAEDHPGARLGVKNVVFCGMRAPVDRRGARLRDRHRAAQDRGARGALVDQRRDRARVVAVAARPLRAGGARRALRRPPRRSPRPPGARRRARSPARPGRATASARPWRVDEAEPAARRASRSVSASTASGVIGPGVDDRRTRRRARSRRSTPAGRSTQPVDRLDAQLVVDQLDDEAS